MKILVWGCLKGGEGERKGVTRAEPCEGRHRNARHHVKDFIGGNVPLYSIAPLLSRGFAKKVFRKIFGKSVDNAETTVYNEHRQAENGQKNGRRKKYDN